MNIKKTLLLATTLLLSNAVTANSAAHWGYSGHQGPENWAKLSGDNFACSGKNQSPIDLTGFVESDLTPLKFSYKSGGNEVVNNGHTVQVNYQAGSVMSIDGQAFNLLQFHFHAPSENHINGHSYPLEAHLVHANKKGDLAVVAVMFEQGESNSLLKQAWSTMPNHKSEHHKLSAVVNVSDMLPKNRDYYRFNGSLTTPPCSEGVRWLVMKNAVQASKQQIDSFKKALHEPNNRPLQAINARTVLQ
jgi:carbonic anhydrase